MLKTRSGIVLVSIVIVLSVCAQAEAPPSGGHWVSAWSTAMHAPLPFPGLPPSPVFENQTIRMIVRPTIAGERVPDQTLKLIRNYSSEDRRRAHRTCGAGLEDSSGH